MDFSKIDINFKNDIFSEENLEFYDVFEGAFKIEGFPHYKQGDRKFLRFPKEKLDVLNDSIKELVHYNSGGVIRFMTKSKSIAIKGSLIRAYDLNFMPRTGMAGVDIYIGSGKNKEFVKNVSANYNDDSLLGMVEIPKQGGCMVEVSIYLPLYNGVDKFFIGIDKDATIEKPIPRDRDKLICFYGSSITHGGCVDKPGDTYVSILSRWLDSEIYNIGLPGSAKGEPYMAEMIGDLDLSLFVLDYDHNAPTPVHLNETYYPFYETVRKKNKTVPILMMTRPDVQNEEGYINKKIIYNAYKQARKNGDLNVHYVDSQEFLKGRMYDEAFVDRCHPNALGSFFIAKGLYSVITQILDGGDINE